MVASRRLRGAMDAHISGLDRLSGQRAPGIWTAAQARAFDGRAQSALAMPGELLMENAGAAVAREAAQMASERALRRCVVLCGAGNNGGDGFVAARHLLGTLEVSLLLAAPRTALRGDALANARRFEACGGRIEEVSDGGALRRALSSPALLVDALFGTGLSRPLEGAMADLVGEANSSGAPILAVDLPSGLDADTGEVLGGAIRATRTLTFVARKRGFDLGRGPAHVGDVRIVGIGVPAAPNGGAFRAE